MVNKCCAQIHSNKFDGDWPVQRFVTKEVDKASIPVPLGQTPWNPWNTRHNTNRVDPRG